MKKAKFIINETFKSTSDKEKKELLKKNIIKTLMREYSK